MVDRLSKPTGQSKIVHVENEQITATEKQIKQELAQKYLSQLRVAVFNQGSLYLEMGRLLKIIKDEKLYLYLGDGGYDSFHQLLGSPELSIGQSMAYALISIYERYMLHFKFIESDLQGIPFYKLQLLATVDIKEKDVAKEWLEKARTLGPNDFRAEVNELKGNKGHEHPIPYPHIYRCKDCGFWRIGIDPKYECHCVEPV